MGNWYASQTGSDSNPGTQAAPLRQFKAALGKAQAGDTIRLAAGQYKGGVRINLPGITVEGETGAQVIASTTDQNVLNCIEVNYDAHNCTLKNLEIIGGYFYACKSDSTWDFGPDYLPYHGAKGLRLIACTLRDSGTDVLKLTPGSDGAQVIGCTMSGSGKRDSSNAQGIDAVNVADLLISDCTVKDCKSGMYLKGGSIRTVVENCKVTNITDGHGIILGQDTDVQWFKDSNTELWESIDGIVRGCTITHVRGAGLVSQAALRPRFDGNTLVDCAYDDTASGYNCAGLMGVGVDHYIPADNYSKPHPRPSRDVLFSNNTVEVKSTKPHFVLRSTGGGSEPPVALTNNRFTGGTAARIKNETQTPLTTSGNVFGDAPLLITGGTFMRSDGTQGSFGPYKQLEGIKPTGEREIIR